MAGGGHRPGEGLWLDGREVEDLDRVEAREERGLEGDFGFAGGDRVELFVEADRGAGFSVEPEAVDGGFFNEQPAAVADGRVAG